MTRQRLYVVFGKGSDAVGLVGSITSPISQAGGNIVDLRQDVLHGLFTILLVVDLADTGMRMEDLSDIVAAIGEDTGLELSVEKYNPIPRDPEKKTVLTILVGKDRPGIIASMSEILGKHNVNIEFAQSIGREGVFLTELLIDISHSSLPLANLQAAVEKAMSDLDIQAVFQSDDVFNKKKRVILFQIGSSFIGSDLLEELSEHTGLTLAEVQREYRPECVTDSLQRAAARLEGLPAEVLLSVASGIQASPGTMELLQTLRVMGYRIALASNAFALFTDTLQTRLGIDYAYGYPLAIDDDSKCVLGEIPAHELAGRDLDQLVAEIAAAEGIQSSDVTVISDEGVTGTPGIRLQLNLGQLLDYVNKNIISREALFGLVGSLGIPRG